MLNEKLEYKQYTKETGTLRLGSRSLSNGLGGYVRALTTVARHFLFANGENPIDNIESTIECLKAWLGFDYNESKINKSAKNEINDIKNYLPHYIDTIYIDADAKKDKVTKILGAKKSTLQFYLYTNPNNKSNDKNSAKAVTYESIIADALNQGILDKYLLKVKGSAFGALTKSSNSNKVNLNSTDEDLITKITAYYLLSQKKQQLKQNWIVVNGVDIINWSTRNNDLNHNDWLVKFTYNNNLLFEKITVDGNVMKIKVNEEWINKYEMQIVSYSDYNPNDGFTYYEDMGANKPLVIYSGSRC